MKLKIAYTQIFLLLTLVPLAQVSAEETHLFEKPRMCALLPDILSPLAVDPALPPDFVAMSPVGPPSIANGLFWGKPSVLEEFFKNPECLKEGIINVQVSQNIHQRGSILEGEKELISEMKRKGFQILNSKKMSFGSYPVWMVRLKSPEREVSIAWIGLNAAEGTVLMLSPVFPVGKKQDLFFETFLSKTKPLDQEAFFRAHGLLLKEGETLVEEGKAQFKMTVEKRNADHKLLIVVEPLNQETQFEIGEVTIGKMGGTWKKNHLIAEVEGEIIYCGLDKKFVTEAHKTSVLIRNVDRFTPNIAALKRSAKNKIYFQ